ncbi:MMPL family transporter [Nocardia pseudobrasiliensis]|uniref:RND superfamily putative drug exporter n=1 Tax=Nocardia pseudobrasiliensis TaxID=45979 RepID=A0A370HPW4_9NOCA|nr:MMPL family transporter [Nocardia pseudobrasiliensis]RDI58944.1 RND superfamily putative drug exporter [Nocardia pseudobrasiliensis]
MRAWSRLVTSYPRLVIALSVTPLLALGFWGFGVFDRMNLSGYDNPDSDSARVSRVLDERFGRAVPDVVVIYRAPAGKTVDDIGAAVIDRIRGVDPRLLARPIESYWTSAPALRNALVSSDRTEALAVATLAGPDARRLAEYPDVVAALRWEGDMKVSGWYATVSAYNVQAQHDLLLADSIALPLTLILLIVIFGSVVAAVLPLTVAGLAILGALSALRLISMVSDVSSFAVSLAAILGLGMGIDYSLFMVSRFREELARGREPEAAAVITVCTAGRTIVFSVALLVCAFAGFTAIPVAMCRSVGIAVSVSVGIAAALSVTAIPAVLTLLGGRVDALSWRRGAIARGENRSRRFWTAVAVAVTDRPWRVALLAVTILVILIWPCAGLRLGGITLNGLPPGNPTRVAQEAVASKFPLAGNGATVVLRATGQRPLSGDSVDAFTASVRHVPHVSEVLRVDQSNDLAVLQVVVAGQDFSSTSMGTVENLRRLPPPPGTTVLVGGSNAVLADTASAVAASLPEVIAIMIAATVVLLFVAFRSLVLPIKAVLMSLLGLTASLGVLAWLFQNDARASLLGATAGPLPAPSLAVMIAVIAGLSTDYETFLVSRIVEAHNSGASTSEAIRTGMGRTGRIITAAATLLILVTGAAGTSQIDIMKIAGVGMAVAIAIDATVVRMLLVPALVELMGEANWWFPRIPYFVRRRGSAVEEVPVRNR